MNTIRAYQTNDILTLSALISLLKTMIIIVMDIVAVRGWWNPDLETPVTLMPDLPTNFTLDYIRSCTLTGFMTNLVTLEAELGITFK